jgi:hypothetical protein
MKYVRLVSSLVFMAALAALSSFCIAASYPQAGPGGPIPGAPQGFGAGLDIGYCYDYLAPYGSWITLDRYGYVWCPRHMGYGWRPYADGHWIWSDYGWCWDSDYDWGWMPFHYGRWGWDDGCGWFWAPGTEWGPAWVFWRSSDLYCGWAPIPPGIAFGMGIDFDAYALGLPLNFWVFVNGPHFLDRNLRRYCLPYERNATVANRTRFQNRYEFRGGRMINEGIDVNSIQRFTGRQVTRYTLANADRPGGPRISGNQAMFYRPAFREDRQARPRQALTPEEARQQMGTARIYEPPQGARAASPESAIRKRQAQEQTLLQRSQAQEQQDLARRQAQEKRNIQSQAEQARIDQQHRAQAAEQQKQHQAERQQMAQRHQREAEQVKRSAPSKPQGNPRRK